VTERPPVSLLGAAEIRRLADELDLRPTKTLGQNFVHDGNTVRRIVAAADLRSTDHVLEIGPGLGSLTLGLLDAVAAVTAVEIDPRLAGLLDRTVAQHAPRRLAALQVITADALHVTADRLRLHNPEVAAPADPTALVANLPYNVAVPVLLHLLAEVPTLRSVLVMVQAEVADRLVAGPGTKIYGSPSVKTAWYGSAHRAGSIGRTVFWPEPGVDSALVAFERREHPRTGDRAAVFAVIDAAFAQRRKTLRSALSGWAGSAAYAETVLRRARVDPSARGEVLTVDDFARIAAALEAIDAVAHE
jgi:16S rRNA (adenine1518-N6/adenine1519-N6)-dimethyltransferase